MSKEKEKKIEKLVPDKLRIENSLAGVYGNKSCLEKSFLSVELIFLKLRMLSILGISGIMEQRKVDKLKKRTTPLK